MDICMLVIFKNYGMKILFINISSWQRDLCSNITPILNVFTTVILGLSMQLIKVINLKVYFMLSSLM